METLIFIIAIMIAMIFFLAGMMKLVKTFEPAEQRVKWTTERSIKSVRLIAIGEISFALLFILPYEFNIIPAISYFAALGLTVLMIGAPISHYKLGEHIEASLTTLLLIAILLVTFFRIFE